MLVSYGKDLAVDWGRAVRNVCRDNPFVRVRLSEDTKAAAKWNTPEGGGMLCAGVDGPVTGHGGDLVCVDDPHKNWAEAWSTKIRTHVWD